MSVFFRCKSTRHLFSKPTKLIFYSFLCIFLFISVNAYSGQSHLKISPKWIEGSANSVPLGQLLSQYANETGCRIYLDETLFDSPTTFAINTRLSHEKGIKKIVSPYSYALVFSRTPGDNNSRITEIHVFKKGQRNGAKFRALNNTGYGSSMNSHSSDTVFNGSGNSASSSGSNSDAGRSINSKERFRQNYVVEKSAYGSPVLKKPSGEKGPDYRMSALEMKKAYENYRQTKYETNLRDSQSKSREAKKIFEQGKRQSREERNQMFKKYIMQHLNESGNS